MRSPLGALLSRATPTVPVPYVSQGRSGMALGQSLFGASTMSGQLASMGGSGTLFSIVNRTSTSTSAVQWKLYRKPANDGRRRYSAGEPIDTRTEVTRHAALDLWNKPNRFYTTQELVESVQQHIDLTGEGYLIIARDGRSSIPLELWPVRPDRMMPVPSTEHFLAGWIYTGPSGEQVPLNLDEVIQIRVPDPEDPYRGMGFVQSILTSVDATRYSGEWNKNFFLNSAQPSGIIQVDKRLGDDEWREMTSRWREQHQGVARAHRVAILEQGKYISTPYTMEDMQFAQLRTLSRDEIREGAGIPKFALGDVDDVNRATAEAARVWFAEQLTVPRCERWKQALNNDLLPMFGTTGNGVEYDYISPVPADRVTDAQELTARSNAALTLVNAGFKPKAVLETVGLPEMPHETPPPPAIPAPPVIPPTPDPEQDPAIPPGARSPFEMLGYRQPLAITAAADDADTELAAVRAQADDARAALLAAWDAQVIPAQITALGEAVRKAVDADDVAALGQLHIDVDNGARVLTTALADMADRAAAQMATEAAQQGVTVTAPTVDQALRNGRLPRVTAFGGELLEIAAAVAIMLQAGLADSAGQEALRLYTPGANADSIAAAVVATLQSMKGWMRRDQLGAALHRAQNLGRLATLKAAPTAEYSASEVHDGNTCKPCSDINGHIFPNLTAAEDTYAGGPYQECLGRIRCRGTIRASWPQG